jgi:hypothetical protein
MGTRLISGILIGFAVLFAGAMNRRHRQFYTKEYLQATKDRFERLRNDAKKKREKK